MAADLTEAAHLTYTRVRPRWANSTIQAQVTLLIADVNVVFSDQIPDDRPVGSWLILLSQLRSQMAAGVLPLPQLDQCVDIIYRMCLAGASQLADGLISAGQGAALLAAWNLRIGP